MKSLVLGTLAIAFGVSGFANAQILTKEPPAGQLPADLIVPIDDGSCGEGKIKQVTAGSNMSSGQMIAGGFTPTSNMHS